METPPPPPNAGPPASRLLEQEPSGWLADATATSRFFRGFMLPFRALPMVRRHPALRRTTGIAAGTTALLLAVLLVLAILGAAPLLERVWPRPDGALRFLWWLSVAFVAGALFTVGAVTLPSIATAPFTDPIASATERVLGAPEPPGGGLRRFVRELVISLGKAVLRLLLLGAGHVLLLGLWVLPFVGQALWTPLALGWTVFWLAFEYLDLPATRHGHSFAEVFATVRENLAVSAGFGAAVYVALWIPGLNALFIPVAAAAGTALFVELRRTGRMAPPRRPPAS